MAFFTILLIVQILAVKDDHVFVWNRRDFSILTISLNQGEWREGAK